MNFYTTLEVLGALGFLKWTFAWNHIVSYSMTYFFGM